MKCGIMDGERPRSPWSAVVPSRLVHHLACSGSGSLLPESSPWRGTLRRALYQQRRSTASGEQRPARQPILLLQGVFLSSLFSFRSCSRTTVREQAVLISASAQTTSISAA